MKSLFLRIFLSFWVAQALFVVLAILVTIVFLGMNGYGLTIPGSEVAPAMMALGSRVMTEEAFAAWLRAGLVRAPVPEVDEDD